MAKGSDSNKLNTLLKTKSLPLVKVILGVKTKITSQESTGQGHRSKRS